MQTSAIRYLARGIVVLLIVGIVSAGARPDGSLRLHFIDVGEGDGALIVSPGGETVLVDNGVEGDCAKPLRYLESVGIRRIEYHINSHYHADHLGCTEEVLSRFPLDIAAYDRGTERTSQFIPSFTDSVPSAYKKYARIIQGKRRNVIPGDEITLDAESASPVRIKFISVNGGGRDTRFENDLSVVFVVSFGGFKAEFGGDLSGDDTDTSVDVETEAAQKVGRIDVYKVHHHCSSHSSNVRWLSRTKPAVGIISVGNGNPYGRPKNDCIKRLHDAGVRTYWTELGNGAVPSHGMDVVAGDIVVEVRSGEEKFSVFYGDGAVDRYPIARPE